MATRSPSSIKHGVYKGWQRGKVVRDFMDALGLDASRVFSIRISCHGITIDEKDSLGEHSERKLLAFQPEQFEETRGKTFDEILEQKRREAEGVE